jgi:WD40 repeat protein
MGQLGGVLAAPVRRPRRRSFVAIAIAVLAVVAVAASLHEFTGARPIATLTDPDGHYVFSVAFSPDGQTLATGDAYDGSTYLWDVATQHQVAAVADPGGDQYGDEGVSSVASSPDGQTLATGDGGGGILAKGDAFLWNVATSRLITSVAGPGSSGVGSVAFSPDGQTLAAGDGDGSTYLWPAG